MDKNDNIVKDGSNPCRTARFAEQNEHSGITDTALTQETAESEDKVKFPKPVKHRGKVLATKAEAKRWFAVKGEDALDVKIPKIRAALVAHYRVFDMTAQEVIARLVEQARANPEHYGDKRRNFVGEHFWVRGYWLSTVGPDEAAVRLYIQH